MITLLHSTARDVTTLCLTALCLTALCLTAPAQAADWQIELSDALDQARAEAPALVEQAAVQPLVQTRAGDLRMVDLGSEWGPILSAQRLVDSREPGSSLSSAQRRGLASATVTRIDRWPDIAVGLVQTETDPEVLAVLLSGLQRVDADLAMTPLRQALTHADAHVRVEAAVVLGDHVDGALATDALLSALDDSDADMRGRAARSLGRHPVATSFDRLALHLFDEDGAVRLQVVRALQQIDGPRVAALAQLSDLATDRDPRVARAVAQITAVSPTR